MLGGLEVVLQHDWWVCSGSGSGRSGSRGMLMLAGMTGGGTVRPVRYQGFSLDLSRNRDRDKYGGDGDMTGN